MEHAPIYQPTLLSITLSKDEVYALTVALADLMEKRGNGEPLWMHLAANMHAQLETAYNTLWVGK